MIRALDIAWAAGFLEGEGTFGLTGTSIRVQAPQKSREPLDWLQNLFGGRVAFVGGIWRWSIDGSAAAAVMMTLWTFMTEKRKAEIEKCLQKWKGQRGARIKSSVYCIHGHDMSKTGMHHVKGRGPRCAECGRIAARKSAAKRRAAWR